MFAISSSISARAMLTLRPMPTTTKSTVPALPESSMRVPQIFLPSRVSTSFGHLRLRREALKNLAVSAAARQDMKASGETCAGERAGPQDT